MTRVDKATVPLHIVLFGPPASGKSALLDALFRAARTQADLLNGRLQELPDSQPPAGAAEVVPHRIRFEPTVPTGPAPEPVEALLLDCNGRAANVLLRRHDPAGSNGVGGALTQAIATADALLLVVDASATPAQVEAEFQEFGRFLRGLEEERGQSSEVT